MDPITIGMLGMAGFKALQGMEDEKADRKLASLTQRYAPWTGNQAQPVKRANPWGDVAQGGAAALGNEQAMKNAGLNEKLVEAQIRAMDRGQGIVESPMLNSQNAGMNSFGLNMYNSPLGAGPNPYTFARGR